VAITCAVAPAGCGSKDAATTPPERASATPVNAGETETPSTSAGENSKATSSLENTYAGATVQFGTYNSQPITWLVLDVQDDKALLVTEDILWIQEYIFQYSKDTWATCAFRKTLNDSTMKTLFSSTERDRIIITNTEPDADDYLFLLSKEEVQQYSDVGVRKASFQGEEWWWQLRPHRNGSVHLPFVSSGGNISQDPVQGTKADYEHYKYDGGIRPTMWVSL
jgi:hypothetical protein